MITRAANPFVAIACGGTGGHLFPGLAIAEALRERGCDLALLVSPKDVDQQAVRSAAGIEIVTLPAVAFSASRPLAFLRGAAKSLAVCRKVFRRRRPQAVIAMGGFTSAPPVLAGRFFRAAAFLHEANSIPGKANRWLAPLVREAFVSFPAAAARLASRRVTVTGTPVRGQFQPADAASCRMALGLEPERPVLLVMGGSQGASAINELVQRALPVLARRASGWQFLHLAGAADFQKVLEAYRIRALRARVVPFLTEMELALGAATVAINRAGASSLAEIAAMQVPSILIPYPHAADNHQFFNARAFMESGAARQIDQASAEPEHLAKLVLELGENHSSRLQMQGALRHWQFPEAAAQIADRVCEAIRRQGYECSCWRSDLTACRAEGGPLDGAVAGATIADSTRL